MEEWHTLRPVALGDLDYDEFSETSLIPFFPIEVCIFSLSSFLSLHLAYVACDDA